MGEQLYVESHWLAVKSWVTLNQQRPLGLAVQVRTPADHLHGNLLSFKLRVNVLKMSSLSTAFSD
jgi:hypothetical protein